MIFPDLVLTDVFKTAGQLATKVGVTYVVGKIFPKSDHSFRKIARKAIDRIDKETGGELFGGNMVSILSSDDAIRIVERLLIPFEEPTKEDFHSLVDVDTLPPDFIDTLKSTILSELEKSPNFLKKLIDTFHVIQQDNLGAEVNNISVNLTTLTDLVSKLATTEGQSKPVKKDYRAIEDYIPRILSSVDQDLSKGGLLTELIGTNKKIILLSAAGIGKSTELKNLAHHSSMVEGRFPLLIRLNTYTNQEISELLDDECSGWEQIENRELLIIFDGLDEVHVHSFEFFILKLIVFSDVHKDSTIIITCRDNFIDPVFTTFGEKGFSIYKLRPLEYWDVVRFVNHKMEATKAEEFLKSVHDLGMFKIISSPFFLIFLLELYEMNSVLPVSKPEVFEKLIDHRIEKDKARFALRGVRISQKIAYIKNQINRLALIMETTGRNYISDDEFQMLIPDYDNARELIEHTFLFDKAGVTTWQFEHNNFQEYLAAKVLVKSSLVKIKEMISLTPDFSMIRPSWVNTLSFLFILARSNNELFKGLLDWLIEIDKEILLRFEKERVEIEIRENIFSSIIAEYRKKGILARSEKFDITDLADYVSESRGLLPAILNDLRETKSHIVINEICRMLPRFSHVNELREEFKGVLESIITNQAIEASEKYAAYNSLARLKWIDKKFFMGILPTLTFNDPYERAGVYRYLTDSGFQDEFVDLILSFIKFDNGVSVSRGRTRSRTNFHLQDDTENRNSYVLSISSLEGVSKILKFFIIQTKSHSIESSIQSILRDGFFDRIKILLEGGNDLILDDVVDLFIALTRGHRKDQAELFIDFFSSTGTARIVLYKVFEKALLEKDIFYSVALIADDPFIVDLITRFNRNELTAELVYAIRNSLAWVGSKELHDIFYKQVNEISGDKFVYQNAGIDHEAVRKSRLQRDLDLLADRTDFIANIKDIFIEIGKDSITENDLWESKREFILNESHLDNNIILETLRHHEGKPVVLTDFVSFLESDKWQWFRAVNLLRYDSQSTHTLAKREIEFIKSWCDSQIPAAKFSTAMQKDSYRCLEVYIAYWVKRFDLPYDDILYLDLLHVDSSLMPSKIDHSNRHVVDESNKFGDWIVSKVGLDKVRKRVIENLTVGIKNTSVVRHHIALCNRQAITEALPFIQNVLNSNSLKAFDLLSVCENFLQLGGNAMLIEGILRTNESFDFQDRQHLIDMLIKHSSEGIVSYLEEQLISSNEESSKAAASKLMKMGNLKGLLYYKEWVNRHKVFDDFIGSRDFSFVPKSEALPILLDMLECYLQPDFNRDYLTNQDQELLDTICKIGAEDGGSYQMVRIRFNTLVELDNAKFLYNYIKRIDQQYNINQMTTLPLELIVRNVDALMK